MKKSICFLLTSVFCLCGLGTLSGCEVGLRLYENEYFIYTIDYDSNDINILGLTDKGREQEYIVVPDTIDGKKVTEFGCYTGLEVSRIEDKYGDAKYAQIKSEKLKKVFIASKIKIVHFGFGGESPFVDCPKLEAVLYICNSKEHIRSEDVYSSSFMDYHKANVSYYYNYENAPNDGYFWIDNYEYGETIEYIPEQPIRDGYTFGGWYRDSACVNEWNFECDTLPQAQYDEQEKEIYQETKLYAKWIKE